MIDINGISFNSSGTSLTMTNGATTWMSVNANGILVQPQRPYMKGKLSGQGSFYRGNPVLFGSVIANVGNCWNNTTGKFTCPVVGRYLVGMGGIASGNANGQGAHGYFYIIKNDAVYHYSHWNHSSYWEYVSLSGIVNCNAGDTISFQINPSTGYWYGGDDHGNFFIALLR